MNIFMFIFQLYIGVCIYMYYSYTCVYMYIYVCTYIYTYTYICQYHDIYLLDHDIKCRSLLRISVRKRIERHWAK